MFNVNILNYFQFFQVLGFSRPALHNVIKDINESNSFLQVFQSGISISFRIAKVNMVFSLLFSSNLGLYKKHIFKTVVSYIIMIAALSTKISNSTFSLFSSLTLLFRASITKGRKLNFKNDVLSYKVSIHFFFTIVAQASLNAD